MTYVAIFGKNVVVIHNVEDPLEALDFLMNERFRSAIRNVQLIPVDEVFRKTKK